MYWDNNTKLKFLQLYQQHSCIWDPQNNYYRSIQHVNHAWNNIQENLGVHYSVEELKKEGSSLMSAYRGYKKKIKESENSGTTDVYEPKWFAFSLMESFLGTVYNCNSGSTEDEELDEELSADQDSIEECNEKNTEQGPSSLPLQQELSSLQKSSTEIPKKKKREYNLPEFIKIKQHQQPRDVDDECSIFGILIAKKLRKLSEERRDIMMVKVNQLFVEERDENIQSLSPSSPSYYLSPPTMVQKMYSDLIPTETVVEEEDFYEAESSRESEIFIERGSSGSASVLEYLIRKK